MDKIKVLIVSDSIQRTTGVALQTLKFAKGLLKTGRYSVVQLGAAAPSATAVPLYQEGIKLYPFPGGAYGDVPTLKRIIQTEKPHIIILFSDPRFFYYIFNMDNEIRTHCKLVLYHTWDNAPFPKYNLPWYSGADHLVMLSHYSYGLMKGGGLDVTCIPHGFDPGEFYPLPDDERAAHRQQLFAQTQQGPNPPEALNFVLFFNNRNIWRKRVGDIMFAYQEFGKKHNDVLLLMNTDIADREGIDLMHFISDFDIEAPIIINPQRVDSAELNKMYNSADATINVSENEGFGLCVGESLSAGTPAIVTQTGGMTEQARNPVTGEEYGIVLKPDASILYGVLGAPYIYRDYLSHTTILNALETAYQEHKRGVWKQRGLAGREFIIQNFNVDETVRLWDEFLQKVYAAPSSYIRWQMSSH